MKWNFFAENGKWVRVLNRLSWIMIAFPIAYCLTRVLVVDSFIVPSESMTPTLNPGDRIWAWKLPYGPRLYRSLDFSDGRPNCFRLPGVGEIEPGDIMVFNSPQNGEHGSGVWFTINDVCCKRVLGCPSHRIGAVDGHCWNDKVLHPIGNFDMQEMLRWSYDSIFIWSSHYYVFPEAGHDWNIKNWGPVTVPFRGLEIDTSAQENSVYRMAVEYETGLPFMQVGKEYVFQHDWFFVLGDNSPSSQDSRFFGFVPDDFVIGVLHNSRLSFSGEP